MNPENPLVVQTDRTVLVETQHPRFEEARERLARFAELQKSPEFVHFYRVTPISVWHAAALGESASEITGYLESASMYPVPPQVLADVREWHGRYGMLHFVPADDPDTLRMESSDAEALRGLLESKTMAPLVDLETAEYRGEDGGSVDFPSAHRGVMKHCLVKLGHPVVDEAGYARGASLELALRDETSIGGVAFAPRDYQNDAVSAFWQDGAATGGCGVVVLPCGAGKTVVGLAAMAQVGARTLVLTTNTVAVRQWKREILDKTTLTEEQVGEYTGDHKDVRPVTIATYQILTWRRRKSDPFVHFPLLENADWGLIVYDEVHLLPAPVFRATAAIQARRRLGLTATLVREDGKEGDVFSLIGPKRCEVPWKELERKGFLAAARCYELRVSMNEVRTANYEAASARSRIKLAAENERKLSVVSELLKRHAKDRVLVIGQYLDQLKSLAKTLGLSLITGRTPMEEREKLFNAFREGRLRHLAVSKVGNFAIDLPDANVLIQVSGTFGSRQEEAQRLGRILRPKGDRGGEAVFYSLVSADTCDEEYGARRQLFLAEQGYAYEIVHADELVDADSADREVADA